VSVPNPRAEIRRLRKLKKIRRMIYSKNLWFIMILVGQELEAKPALKSNDFNPS
jgi:hypothetical protein